MKILVLGGCGRMGSVVAADLSKTYEVVVADTNPKADLVMDGGGYNSIIKMLGGFDLIVGALPSAFGHDAMLAAIDSGINYVDLSFTSFDVSRLNDLAVKNNITVFHDCGVAPGLSHLVAGRAIENGADDVTIYVGGIAKEQSDDYVITWSVDDLYEEYIRPARVVLNGRIEEFPALSGVERFIIPTENLSISSLEAFYTDGLRSLLSKRFKVKNIVEKTMRWPGHTDKIKPLLGNEFSTKMKEMYRESNDDMLIMAIDASRFQSTKQRRFFIVYGDEQMSAMARTTALACSAFAQLMASGKYKTTGVIAPEDIAENDEAYKFILDRMSDNNVEFNEKYPFLNIWREEC